MQSLSLEEQNYPTSMQECEDSRNKKLGTWNGRQHLPKIIHEIYTGKPNSGQIPVELNIDSKNLLDSIHSTKQVDEKTIRHLVAWIKQQKEEQTVKKIDWVPTEDMLADVFTKKNVKTDDILQAVIQGNLGNLSLQMSS